MTKAQKKALQIAKQHFDNGNEFAFKAQVNSLIRSASNAKQIQDIKAAAMDIQYLNFQHSKTAPNPKLLNIMGADIF